MSERHGAVLGPRERPMEQQGFIDQTVKWALALLVEERRRVIVEARRLACLLRHPHDGLHGLTHFDADAWDEIARRVEMEGHTPVPPDRRP